MKRHVRGVEQGTSIMNEGGKFSVNDGTASKISNADTIK